MGQNALDWFYGRLKPKNSFCKAVRCNDWEYVMQIKSIYLHLCVCASSKGNIDRFLL